MKRRLCFESCERRDLLAADFQAWHDPTPATAPAEQPGDEVTRIVRIFNNGDEDGLAEVHSSLNVELENPTWHRLPARGKEFHNARDFAGREPDLSVKDVKSFAGLKPIGDINGDGKTDFVFLEADWRNGHRVYLLLGGTTTGGDISEAAVSVSVRAERQALSPLGDLDGDGFDDFVIGKRVIWGHADLQPGGKLLAGGDSIHSLGITDARALRPAGDFNGDGYEDIIVRTMQDSVLILGGPELRHSGAVTSSGWIGETQRGIGVTSQIYNAAPAGDLNDDGYSDLFVTGWGHPVAVASVIFGGPSLQPATPLDFDNLTPEQGFHVTNFIDANIYEYDVSAVQASGWGDVNGDGVDDLLIGFDGSRCGGGCHSDSPPLAGGAILILGGANVGADGVIDQPSSNVIPYKVFAAKRNISFPKVVDANGDEHSDLQFVVDGTNVVIFGHEQMSGGTVYDRDQPGIPLRGDNGFQLHARASFVDLDGNGVSDLLAVASPSDDLGPLSANLDFYLDIAQPSVVIPNGGTGDIAEVIPIPAGTSMVYTITGRLRAGATKPIATTVAPRQPTWHESLMDNTAGAEARPLIDVDIQATSPLVAGHDGTIEVTVTNYGPWSTGTLNIAEDVTGLFDDARWTRTTQIYPASVPLARADQLHGFAINGSGRNNTETPEEIFSVGVLGDINNDGVVDLRVADRTVLGGPGFGDSTSLSAGGGQFMTTGKWAPWGFAGIGDINHDGVDDLAGWSRELNVVLGGEMWAAEGGLQRVPVTDLDMIKLHEQVSFVRPLGDLDGDGRADYLAYSNDRYYVLIGPADRLFRLQHGLQSESGFHRLHDIYTVPIQPIGDVNADGFDDVVVWWENRETEAYVVLGGSDAQLLGRSVSERLPWESILDLPGFTLPGRVFLPGDVNGDGIGDVVGQGYVLYGSPTLSEQAAVSTDDLNGENGFRWSEPDSMTPTEVSLPRRRVTTVADFNGDGYDDLIGGHAFYRCPTDGSIFVYFGGPTSPTESDRVFQADGVQGFVIEQLLPEMVRYYDYTGGCLIADDFNGDGAADILYTDVTRTAQDPGTVYALMGHRAVKVTGVGELRNMASLPAGASVTYRIEGVVRQDVSPGHRARVAVSLADDGETLSRLLLSDTLVLAPSSHLQADLNGDSRVDFADFLLLSDNYGRKDVAPEDGDMDGDGRVDFVDFLLLREHFARSV